MPTPADHVDVDAAHRTRTRTFLPMLSVTAAFLLSTIVIDTFPQMAAEMGRRFTVTEAQSGIIAALTLAASAVLGLAAVPLMKVSRNATLALIGAVVTAVGYALASDGDSTLTVGAALVVAAAGGGLTGAVGGGAIAAFPNPDKTYAVAWILSTLIGGALIAGLGVIPAHQDVMTGFATVSLTALLALPVLVKLPTPTGATTSAPEQRSTPVIPLGRSRRRPIALTGLLVTVIGLSASSSALWVQLAALGTRATLDEQANGYALAGSYVAGIAGAAVAAALPARVNRVVAATVAGSINAAAVAILFAGAPPILFIATSMVWGTLYSFLTPLMFGAAAVLDATGRWVAALTTAAFLGAALGAWAIGAIIDVSGYRAAAVLALIVTAMCTITFVPAMRLTAGDR